MVIELTDTNFQTEVIQSEVPVLVDFWATWCGPCKMLAPILEELAVENEGKPVKVAKIEVETYSQAPAQYQVMSLPTLIIFKGGQPVKQMIGVQDKQTLQAALDEVMS